MQKGFTLIELLIVIAIIGILSSFLMSNFIGVRQRARDAQRKSDLQQIRSALEMYRADQGSYPTALATCGVGISLQFGSPAVTYMQKIPCDPSTNKPYGYSSASPYSAYSLSACLENTNDLDAKNGGNCPAGAAGLNYTLTQP